MPRQLVKITRFLLQQVEFFNEFSRVLIVIWFVASFPSILFSVTALTSLLNAK